MSKHNTPSTGDGKTSGVKPGKAECAVMRPSGSVMPKATSKLFGVFKKKGS